jgi:thioredoxin 1
MGPRLRRISKIFKGKMVFGKLNTQENEDIVKKYKIFGIPQLIFFYNGKKISSITGVKSVGTIKNTIEEFLEKISR